ncbi:unnamed protein product [Tilletia controversa]|nr:unnamed protein product [Tilletia controversa]
MATWEHQLPLPLSVAAKASLLVDDDNLNADQGSGLHAADADDDKDDGETDFPDHPLDRHSAPAASGLEQSAGDEEEINVERFLATVLNVNAERVINGVEADQDIMS